MMCLFVEEGNLFDAMFEAEGDPPSAEPSDTVEPAAEPPVDTGGDMMGSDPPDIGSDDPPEMDYQDDGGMGEEGGVQEGGQEEDNTTLDEKGEIFAKLDILKSYNSLYQKLEDTIDTIDKIDLVQTGNNINPNDVADVKDQIAELMEDVSSTIIYEFQQSYANLKIKLVAYSAKYVTYMKQLVKLIKKDQGVKPE